MADPRIVAPMQRHQKRSPLLEAQAAVQNGDIVNACQYGCEVEDLDNNGYCRHLVGFTRITKPGEPEAFDPRKPRYNENGEIIAEFVDGSDPQPVLKTDIKVRITGSCRVYRDVDRYPPKWLKQSAIEEAVA